MCVCVLCSCLSFKADRARGGENAHAYGQGGPSRCRCVNDGDVHDLPAAGPITLASTHKKPEAGAAATPDNFAPVFSGNWAEKVESLEQ